MEISDVTSKLMEEYTKKTDELLRYKISLLERKAMESGDTVLASLLHHLLYQLGTGKNVEIIAKEIEKHGYSLEIDTPQPRYDFEQTDKYLMKAIIDVEKVKVRVKKLIAEV